MPDQLPPAPNDRPAVWPLVVADMQDRDRLGRHRYGVPLQPFNGRDQLQDLYEELLDAAVYVKAAMLERGEAVRAAMLAERARCAAIADRWAEIGRTNSSAYCEGLLSAGRGIGEAIREGRPASSQVERSAGE